MNAKKPEDNKKILRTIAAELFLQNTVKRFKAAIKEHPAGFTFDIITLQLKTNFSSEIYLVGQPEHGISFKADPRQNDLKTWIYNNFSAICKSGGIIGGWNSDGILFLDVVAVISGYENAMLSGQVNGEEAIYHPYSSSSIKVTAPQIDTYLSGDA